MMIAMLVALAACSNKTNTARSRFWQSFTTKYNVYYHGKTNYDEQMKAMMDAYEDDYTQQLYMHPAEARSNPKAKQPGGSFDRTIEKMEKAIALHSIKKKPKRKSGKGRDAKYQEWLSRDEYNPYLHNAWYLMAKAQYMKGDFLDAAATFRYIARHFTWKKDLVQECQVREALCYCAMGWTTEADNVLAHVHMDEITSKKVRALANAAFADYHIKAQEAEAAIPYMEQAVKGFKGNEKVRMNFILGQLYEKVGDKHNAYLAYKRAGSSSGSTYRTKFNARIKQSAVYEGANIADEVKALKRMTRYDRNKNYLDQVYYAIGNLYLSHGDTVSAIENYKLAAEKSTQNGVEKAISQLTLGGIYFDQRRYDEAQPCYAEAIPQINEDYPNYKMLKKRSDVLDELAVYSQNVILQDSLLWLSSLPLEKQKEVIAKIIEDLKKKEKEEAENAAREAYLAEQQAKGNAKIGSTLKGIGPTYTDKVSRVGLRVGDTLAANFKERFEALKAKHIEYLRAFDFEYNAEEHEAEWLEAVEYLKKFKLIDGEYFANECLENNKKILAEGAQGSMLDIDFGSYPFVTSSNTICPGACVGLGIAPRHVGRVYGIFKAYCTRVGSGPFPTELFDETGERLRNNGAEYGAVTGRPRRCGWLDLVALKYAIMLNGVTDLIMMKADVMDDFDTIKVATSYIVDGEPTKSFPFDTQADIQPVYKEFKGWHKPLSGARSESDFPYEFRVFIKFIEEELKLPVKIISVGADREQTIVREEDYTTPYRRQ